MGPSSGEGGHRERVAKRAAGGGGGKRGAFKGRTVMEAEEREMLRVKIRWGGEKKVHRRPHPPTVDLGCLTQGKRRIKARLRTMEGGKLWQEEKGKEDEPAFTSKKERR